LEESFFTGAVTWESALLKGVACSGEAFGDCRMAEKDFRIGAALEVLMWQMVSVFFGRSSKEKAPPLRRLFNPLSTPF
jgi:hypothetical protein